MLDICLLLEGTYPYVSGGVSTWVHQLIEVMKDVRFGIVFIAPHSDPTREMKYTLPSNVIYLQEIYLHDYNMSETRSRDPKAADYQLVKDFYQGLRKNDFKLFEPFAQLFEGADSCLDLPTVFSSKEIWEILADFAFRLEEPVSFLDYFWTWRGTHLPLAQILQSQLPSAKIYHAVSTGYAGLLGSLATVRHQGKFFLTEHGIYTYERILEITQAYWIYEREKVNFRAERDLSFFKQWWVEMFRTMSRLAYRQADRIFTLYEGNKAKQVLEGARDDKVTIIPNGIDVKHYQDIVREKKPIAQIGLIGRVVTIKDIKTYIQAAKMVLNQGIQAEFYIIGPTDEEPEYYEECQQLIDALGVDASVRFTGRVDIKDYLRFLDVIVLTSLSEAQPYVILEANIVGIPMVTTDVGACREMLEGRTEEDKALGISGLITSVSSPEQTAEAIQRLLSDTQLYHRCQEAGKERVRRFYHLEDMISRYLNIYEQNLF